jgi:hypothetical protein
MGSLMAGWNSPVLHSRRESCKGSISLTKQAIESFWETKRVIEELCALAEWALAEKQGKLLLMQTSETEEEIENKPEEQETISFGIKDWWTKSSYAFLNQPPLMTMDGVPKYRFSAQYLQGNIVKTAAL